MPNRLTTFWSALMTSPRRMAGGRRMFRPAQRTQAPLELARMPATAEFPFPSLFARTSRGRDGAIVGVKPPAALAWPWCKAIATLELLAPPLDDQDQAPHQHARAVLQPGAITLGGVPVLELHNIDDGESREWHYLLACSYLRGRASLRTLIERRGNNGTDARMQEDPLGRDGLYLPTEAGGLWLHADPEDARRARLVCVRMR
ncbi:hypothetical protein [Pseudoxanthomonas indica]|uniref:Uncharacterized protein n=1 Tax=Pseudoxanthomonas indica TaxID=428993 RepID=A0A1T5LJL5_9GAMM|nr:hypothetical protein [Pseudoxanthomonas indica]GGD36045.1 hypothetical protein GCM10007235_05060 [Pseudoxanthomonas indica]SKC76196.1 hypothetical protein SAMN06296058_2631 [Pseudoxanthomonas indica]